MIKTANYYNMRDIVPITPMYKNYVLFTFLPRKKQNTFYFFILQYDNLTPSSIYVHVVVIFLPKWDQAWYWDRYIINTRHFWKLFILLLYKPHKACNIFLRNSLSAWRHVICQNLFIMLILHYSTHFIR